MVNSGMTKGITITESRAVSATRASRLRVSNITWLRSFRLGSDRRSRALRLMMMETPRARSSSRMDNVAA